MSVTVIKIDRMSVTVNARVRVARPARKFGDGTGWQPFVMDGNIECGLGGAAAQAG
jgi:hypothetical protein